MVSGRGVLKRKRRPRSENVTMVDDSDIDWDFSLLLVLCLMMLYIHLHTLFATWKFCERQVLFGTQIVIILSTPVYTQMMNDELNSQVDYV